VSDQSYAEANGGTFFWGSFVFPVRARRGEGGVVVVATIPRFMACFIVRGPFQGFMAVTVGGVVVAVV
jgi:hypothetical protein